MLRFLIKKRKIHNLKFQQVPGLLHGWWAELHHPGHLLPITLIDRSQRWASLVQFLKETWQGGGDTNNVLWCPTSVEPRHPSPGQSWWWWFFWDGGSHLLLLQWQNACSCVALLTVDFQGCNSFTILLSPFLYFWMNNFVSLLVCIKASTVIPPWCCRVCCLLDQRNQNKAIPKHEWKNYFSVSTRRWLQES